MPPPWAPRPTLRSLTTCTAPHPPPAELRDVIAATLGKHGFFILVNHTVPADTIAAALRTAREFFGRMRAAAAGRRNRYAEAIRMDEMLRPMTKASRGLFLVW